MILNAARALIIVGSMLLAGCGGGSAAVTPVSPQSVGPAASDRPVTQSDADIAALLYIDTQRTPAGFRTDPVPTFNGYVSTVHIKAPDIGPEARPYELCTDDWNQALQWSELAAGNGSSYDALTGNEESDLYYEFDRLRAGTPQGYIRQRVFKCSFVNRDDVDLRQASGAAGQLHVMQSQAAALGQLSEYLWEFTAYNNTGNVVLRSVAGSSAGTLTQSLFIASLTAGVGGACDSIHVIQWKHSLDLASGALTRSVTPLWSFAARDTQGTVSLCTN